MHNSFGKILLSFLLFGTIAVIFGPTQTKSTGNTSVVSDTVIVCDTIVMPPSVRDSVVYRYRTIAFPIDDTIKNEIKYIHDTITDSIKIQVPISRKTYEDSSFVAVISGYNATLDSMIIKRRNITNTVTRTEIKRNKLALGLSLGYDPLSNSPHITIGVNYNILPIR